jgi:hypothetical protein
MAKRYFVVDVPDDDPLALINMSDALPVDMERQVLFGAIDFTLKAKAGSSFRLRLEADVLVDENGEDITRMADVRGSAYPWLAIQEGSRETAPPPDHALGSDPHHPRGCRCPKCA